MRLEDLTVGSSVKGLVNNESVQVVAVKWYGSSVLELTFKNSQGMLANQLLYREDEARLEVLDSSLPWSFDADGDTVRLALEAADALAAKGIGARVLDVHTIKPLDVEAVTACIDEIGKVITVEDHNIMNGLGSAVAEVIAEAGKGKLKRIGIQDQFGQSAPYERLLAMNGITVENIVAQAETLCR